MVTIREATPADVPAVAALAAHFLATPYARQYFRASSDRLELFVSFLVDTPGCTVLVADDAGVVGFLALLGGLNPLDEAGEFCEEIAWWVEPRARGRGRIGAQLLAAAEQWARANAYLWLKMIAPSQSRVGRFYERSGYAPLETAYVKGLGHGDRLVVRPGEGREEVRPPDDRQR
jgi:GNAT superfamily N-acetyltransferase